MIFLPKIEKLTIFLIPDIFLFVSFYYFKSDASAIIEHTKQVLFLEDDDVAAAKDGILSIHRMKSDDSSVDEPTKREIHTLKMELQQIMKGRLNLKYNKVGGSVRSICLLNYLYDSVSIGPSVCSTFAKNQFIFITL